jgi:SAM-dependent methyltransferase
MEDEDPIVKLRRELCGGAADDDAFDRLYSAPIRAKSSRFWTPVAVAHRAAQLFASQDVERVLDVGSGAGKFCIIAACACPGIEFTGVEQRPHLVTEARRVVAQLGVDNARFFAGDATKIPWIDFDGLYLYNPFAENLYRDADPLDQTVELSQRRLVADVRRVLAALVAAPIGRCMVTYNSFGGPIPATYELVHEERAGIDWLRLWVKRRSTVADGSYYYEGEDRVILFHAAADAREATDLSRT